jgi:hypothetical protein
MGQGQTEDRLHRYQLNIDHRLAGIHQPVDRPDNTDHRQNGEQHNKVRGKPVFERKWAKGKLKIDYIGISLITLGLGCLQVMLDRGEDTDHRQNGEQHNKVRGKPVFVFTAIQHHLQTAESIPVGVLTVLAIYQLLEDPPWERKWAKGKLKIDYIGNQSSSSPRSSITCRQPSPRVIKLIPM